MNQRTFITKARGIFSDNNGARYIPRQRSGPALDYQRVALADAGETRIFSAPQRRQYADYQIAFLIDASGSMRREDKIGYATATAHALFYSLREAGANVRAYAFNTKIRELEAKVMLDADALLARLYDLANGPDNYGNHDGYAVRFAAKELMRATSTPARVIFTFSDGVPQCDYDCAGCGGEKERPGCFYGHGDKALRSAIKWARAKAVKVLAIGLGTDAAVNFYGEKNARTIKDLNLLYTSAARLLERNLVRG